MKRLRLGSEALVHYLLVVLQGPAYREANAGALRMGCPRIPLGGRRGADADSSGCSTPEAHAYWRNVPAAVWNYRLGGYRVY